MSLTMPDGSEEHWSYNGNGDVTGYTNPLSQVIYYTYDDAGRMTGVDYPTGTDTTFAYDNANRRTSMVDTTGTTSWSYDNANRLTGLNTPQGNMSYAYDDAGRRTSMTDSSGTTTYTYDAANRITSLQNPFSETTSWQYDDADRMTKQTFASGAYTDYTYDSWNRPSAITHKKSDNTTISAESYVYDDAGNLSSKTVDSITTSYTYDVIDQLTQESRTGYNCTYGYDANGNRSWKALNGDVESYTYDDGDKLTHTVWESGASKDFTYDAAGRTTAVTSNNQTTSFAYDYESRITQITYPNQSTNTFAYSGAGARVAKTDSMGSKSFRRDGARPVDPVIADGTTSFTPGVSTRTSGTSKFAHADRAGSIGIETDASQAVAATKQFDAFGLPLSSSGSASSHFGYAGDYGYQADPDSGLYQVGLRTYDPSTGRFLTRDPAFDGRNWYAYCANSPTNAVDPWGLTWYYDQRTGDLWWDDPSTPAFDPVYVGRGFSGGGANRNIPEDEGVPGGVDDNGGYTGGPIPKGRYKMGFGHSKSKGGHPYSGGCIWLTESPHNNMHDRRYFLIHGGAWANNPSQGCIIMSKAIRDQIEESGDDDLIVYDSGATILDQLYWFLGGSTGRTSEPDLIPVTLPVVGPVVVPPEYLYP